MQKMTSWLQINFFTHRFAFDSFTSKHQRGMARADTVLDTWNMFMQAARQQNIANNTLENVVKQKGEQRGGGREREVIGMAINIV